MDCFRELNTTLTLPCCVFGNSSEVLSRSLHTEHGDKMEHLFARCRGIGDECKQKVNSGSMYLLISSNPNKKAVSSTVFKPPNEMKKYYFVLRIVIWVSFSHFPCLNHCEIVWLLALLASGLLVVFLVGLPRETSAAWSSLLHQTAGQEMCSAPQHAGRITFANVVSPVTVLCVCCTPFIPGYLSRNLLVVTFASLWLFLVLNLTAEVLALNFRL